jgi:hypothetical protein
MKRRTEISAIEPPITLPPRPHIFRPARFTVNTTGKLPLVVFGDGMFDNGNHQKIRGKNSSIVGVIWRELKRRERSGDLVTVTVDEYLSSQVSILYLRFAMPQLF